jgi:protein-tyrosine phosphatase
MKTVLFLCTANFYRSRFAEAYFNHHAALRDLTWRAESRGILADRIGESDISPYTLEALRDAGVPSTFRFVGRQQLTDRDFRSAQRVIVLDRREHEPLMYEHFPRWFGSVEYWTVPDVDHLPPRQALGALAKRIDLLVEELAEAQGPQGT